MFSPTVHVPNRASLRPVQWHLKRHLACAREPGKDYSNSPLSPSTPGLVVRREQCAQGATFAPPSTRPTDIYRRLKRRLGCTLRGIHSKRRLVGTRKSPPYQFLGTQGSSSGSQEFRAAVQGTDCPHRNRQHNCSLLHQQSPGWPNMPWFWDLLSLSSQIPFSLPLERHLLTQPFNGLLHRNLNHLNLHAWLLEPRPSGDNVFLMKWQQELKLLKEVQPEPFINQSGPFLLSGGRFFVVSL